MTQALYAATLDPITYGHLDIIERAAKSFEYITLGIGQNIDKKPLFSLEERMHMAQQSTAHLPNVNVVSFKGLLVDYAYEQRIPLIVKGVRDPTDFNYEMILHQVGESQRLGIDTFFLPAQKDKAHISSSAVKALQREQGLVHEYVPLYVKQCLEAKISRQYILGVTGDMGSGKSYVSQKISELHLPVPIHHIELDHIGHRILGELDEPLYQETRNHIAKTFGTHVQQANGMIDRKSLGEIVFEDPHQLQKLNELLYQPLLLRLRKELYGKEGLILLNAALLVETEMSYLCNNHVLLVRADPKSQEQRLYARGLSPEQIQRRLENQYRSEQKQTQIEEKIAHDRQGKLWTLDNNDDSILEMEPLLNSILETLHILVKP